MTFCMFSRKLLKLKGIHTRILPSDSVGLKIYLRTVYIRLVVPRFVAKTRFVGRCSGNENATNQVRE